MGIKAFINRSSSVLSRGADRFFWASLQPDQTAARWRLPSGQSVIPTENPAGSAGQPLWSAPLGVYLARAVAGANLVAHFARGDAAAITPSITPGWPMDATAPVAYPSERDVLVFREVMQWTQNADAAQPASIGTVHGFTCQFDTEYTGYPTGCLTAAVLKYVGIAWQVRTGTWALVTKRQGASAVISPLTLAEYNGANFALVEHRLYQPTQAVVGRYELWINQQRTRVVQGNDANFPQPTLNTNKYGALAYLSDNYAGKTGGLRVRFSEIFTCADTASALAY